MFRAIAIAVFSFAAACASADVTLLGWQNASKTHFRDGGTFDQIYQPGRR